VRPLQAPNTTMKASSSRVIRERRAQSDPPSPSVSHDTVKKLMESPYFKRLVQLHVNHTCRQALKDGKIRLASPPNTIFMPRVDIVDDPSSSRVVANFELPGVRNNEVTMHLHDGKLHIRGERRPRLTSQKLEDRSGLPQASGPPDEFAPNAMEVDGSQRRVAHPVQELKYGNFQRILPVPSNLQHTDISARFQDGMLIVTWPRSYGGDVTLPPSDSESLANTSAANL